MKYAEKMKLVPVDQVANQSFTGLDKQIHDILYNNVLTKTEKYQCYVKIIGQIRNSDTTSNSRDVKKQNIQVVKPAGSIKMVQRSERFSNPPISSRSRNIYQSKSIHDDSHLNEHMHSSNVKHELLSSVEKRRPKTPEGLPPVPDTPPDSPERRDLQRNMMNIPPVPDTPPDSPQRPRAKRRLLQIPQLPRTPSISPPPFPRTPSISPPPFPRTPSRSPPPSIIDTMDLPYIPDSPQPHIEGVTRRVPRYKIMSDHISRELFKKHHDDSVNNDFKRFKFQKDNKLKSLRKPNTKRRHYREAIERIKKLPRYKRLPQQNTRKLFKRKIEEITDEAFKRIKNTSVKRKKTKSRRRYQTEPNISTEKEPINRLLLPPRPRSPLWSPARIVDDSSLENRPRGIRIPKYKLLPEIVTRNKVKRHNIDQSNENPKRSRISESKRFIGISKRNRRRPPLNRQIVSKPMKRYKMLPQQVSREKFKKRNDEAADEASDAKQFKQATNKKTIAARKKEGLSHKGRHKFIFENWQSL
jgi:hypothetical protein